MFGDSFADISKFTSVSTRTPLVKECIVSLAEFVDESFGLNVGSGKWFGGFGNEDRDSIERTEFAFSVDANGATGGLKDVGE